MSRVIAALSTLVACFALVACGGTEPSIDSLRHDVCDPFAAGFSTTARTDALALTIPRQLRELTRRDTNQYTPFAKAIKEWSLYGGQTEHTPDEDIDVIAQECSPELHDHGSAVCRDAPGSPAVLVLFGESRLATRRGVGVDDILDGDAGCRSF